LLLACTFIPTLTGCTAPKTEEDHTELTISAGKLRGAMLADNHDVITFKGIPYAKPPIGALRWASPQPAKPWSGILDATDNPLACMQQITPEIAPTYGAIPQSEDCLYLNVFAPAQALKNKAQKPLPVLFLIHGGGRARSSASRIQADIAEFNRQGIVVVTPQYRLGIFSFLAHPELSADSPHGVSGNYGTQDLLTALKWVQTNIEHFGGDASSVTILGPSGGGTAVGVLLATPLSKGLFHRAAPLCSNAGITRMHHLKTTNLDQASAEELGVRFADELNADSLEELRALPATQIQQLISNSGIASYDVPSGVGDVIDGWMFPQSIIEMHRTGARNDVPILLGFNADEVSLFGNAGLIDDTPENSNAYENSIKIQYGDLSNRFLKQYPADNLVHATYDVARDRVVSYGSETLARFSNMVTSPTYLYYMAHRPADADQPVKNTGRTRGISHCTGYKYFTGWYPTQGADEGDQKLAKTMSDYLITFIKSGNPNKDGLENWMPYEASAKNYMHFENGTGHLSSDLLPGMWELHESMRLRDEEQGHFRHWLGGWASDSSLAKNRIKSE